jgi:agmatine/peptidylarginine deiminase
LGNGADVCCVAQSQLDWNQQLGIEQPHVTTTLQRLTGAKELVYLEPLVGEPTEHLDWFLTFPSPDTVVVGQYRSEDPVNARLLDRHAKLLSRVKTRNRPLRVERIPMPPRGEDYFGGTYTNVIYANGVLLVPTWPNADAANREALAVYRRLLPDWDVIGIDCEQLVKREGALHCATRNIYRLP